MNVGDLEYVKVQVTFIEHWNCDLLLFIIINKYKVGVSLSRETFWHLIRCEKSSYGVMYSIFCVSPWCFLYPFPLVVVWAKSVVTDLDKREPAESVRRRRKQCTDKPTTKVPGQELVAWLLFENRHADPGSICALWLL